MTDILKAPVAETELQELIEQAHTVCQTSGDLSSECAVAWDTVEEVQAAAADRRAQEPKSNFERYCEERPDALECKIYDT